MIFSAPCKALKHVGHWSPQNAQDRQTWLSNGSVMRVDIEHISCSSKKIYVRLIPMMNRQHSHKWFDLCMTFTSMGFSCGCFAVYCKFIFGVFCGVFGLRLVGYSGSNWTQEPIEILNCTFIGATLVCNADSGLLLADLIHYILKIAVQCLV